MPVEETKDLRLCLGVLVHAVDSLLVLLPTVNIGVNQNNEAFEPSLLCVPCSHQMDSSVTTASLETLWLVLLRLRDYGFMGFPLIHFQHVLELLILISVVRLVTKASLAFHC